VTPRHGSGTQKLRERALAMNLSHQALAMNLSHRGHLEGVVRWVIAVTLAMDDILLVLWLSKLLLLLWLSRLLLLAWGTAGCLLLDGEATPGGLASGMMDVNHLQFRSRRV
jgi:hypothetical protein